MLLIDVFQAIRKALKNGMTRLIIVTENLDKTHKSKWQSEVPWHCQAMNESMKRRHLQPSGFLHVFVAFLLATWNVSFTSTEILKILYNSLACLRQKKQTSGCALQSPRLPVTNSHVKDWRFLVSLQNFKDRIMKLNLMTQNLDRTHKSKQQSELPWHLTNWLASEMLQPDTLTSTSTKPIGNLKCRTTQSTTNKPKKSKETLWHEFWNKEIHETKWET